MRVLLTGGAGFIGSNLSEELIERGYKVIIYDNYDEYYQGKKFNLKNLAKRRECTIIEGDILDYEKTLEAMKKTDIVIHLAAQPGVRYSTRNPEKTFKVNVLGTLNVLKAAKQSSVKKVVFASSSSVYGNPEYTPIDEKHPTNPISIYGISKLAAEKICLIYHRMEKLPVVILRYHTVYGPRQRPDMAIHKWTKQILDNKPVTVYGDGRQIRDFTYVSDVVDATIKAMEKEGIEGEIFNIGSGKPIEIIEVIKLLAEIIGKEVKIKYEEPKPGDVKCTHAEILKAKRKLNYNPKTPLREGLTNFVEWYKLYGSNYYTRYQ